MTGTRLDDQAVFEAARKLEPRDARQTCLRQLCGADQAQEQRIAALLNAYDDSDSFLEVPPVELDPASTLDQSLQHLPGMMIGPYKLREVIGEGGMGIVCVAEQERPLRRKVALKVIKPGMDTREVIARFEVERQALALMDHPHIAKVFDAGTTDSGRPYFVMELVRGMPITDYCDRATVTLGERLGLFVKICQAIEHAHRKGVIHRDLKPSNLLVTLHDGVPVPKVIDFGVAKAINQRLNEHTLYTRHAQVVGTPLYMSPEQAELSGLDVDTRSDVYSLGVLLYELLTGTTPFDRETLSKVGLDEMRRMIREDEPPRPSHRVGTLAGERLSTVSANRGLDPRRLKHALRRELDWIVMKALEKDRERRYESASALAADVQRYLDDQPVQACPPSMGYRLRKFVRRQRRALVMAAGLLVLAVCGPLAAYALFILSRGAEPSLPKIISHPGRAEGRELKGLVPDPVSIPEIGRWQLITKKPRGVLTSAVWSRDHRRLALTEDNHVRVYDASNLNLLHVLMAHTEPVTSLAWSPDGKWLASASEDNTVRVWTSDGAPALRFLGHSDDVYQVAWRPDGRLLASSAADGTVRLWDTAGSTQRVIEALTRRIYCLDWSPDGELLASGGGDIRWDGADSPPIDNSVRIWNAKTGKLIRQFDVPLQESALSLDWRADGKQLAAGYGDPWRSTQYPDVPPIRTNFGIRIWNIDGTPGPGIDGQFGSIDAVAWDPQGRRLAFGGRHDAIRIWDAERQALTGTSTDRAYDVSAISWRRDGSELLITSQDAVRVWDGDQTTTAVVNGLLAASSAFTVVRWSSDGKAVAGGLQNGSTLFFTSEGQPLPPPERPAGNRPAWWELDNPNRRPDGTAGPTLEGLVPAMHTWAWNQRGWLAGASAGDPAVFVWDDTGKLVATRTGYRGGVCWSPDGEWLATGGGDRTQIWKPDGNGQSRPSHEDYPVAWSPDGKWIAGIGSNSRIRLRSPNNIDWFTFRGHQWGIQDIAWSPDSRRIATGSRLDATLRVWNVEGVKLEWLALLLAPDVPVTLSLSGQPWHGDRELLESSLWYVVERPDGSMELMTFGDFRKRYARPLIATYADRCTQAAAKGDWAAALAAFADAVTFQSDVSAPIRQQIVEIGRGLDRALQSRREQNKPEDSELQHYRTAAAELLGRVVNDTASADSRPDPVTPPEEP